MPGRFRPCPVPPRDCCRIPPGGDQTYWPEMGVAQLSTAHGVKELTVKVTQGEGVGLMPYTLHMRSETPGMWLIDGLKFSWE